MITRESDPMLSTLLAKGFSAPDFVCPICEHRFSAMQDGSYHCAHCGSEFKWNGKKAGDYWVGSLPPHSYFELYDKLHRRNQQIADLKRQIFTPLSWITISDLFFNSEEASSIEFDTDNESETKDSVEKQVSSWCSKYPEIGNNIDQKKLVDDFLSRI